jgi:small-conductance mechanosensitive channel
MDRYLNLLPSGLLAVLIIVGVVLAGLMVHWLLFGIAKRVAARTRRPIDNFLIRRARPPVRLLIPLLFVTFALPELRLLPHVSEALQRVVAMAFIAMVAWLIIALVNVVEDVIEHRYPTNITDNLLARRIQTQTRLLRRIFATLVLIVASALILMKFPSIQHLGVSLLASAGLAGLVAGIAARPVLSNLVAGMQIAFSQPIRIDDAVVVENEFGRIEEITTTYVVIKLWDLRRLIVPLSHFIEHPFQNWTRSSTELIGTVLVHVDYTVPIEDVRRELHRILQSTDLWDQRVWNLQVTEASDASVELRAMLSASDAGRLWDLRVYVRERLIGFLQQRYPDALPRQRAEISRMPPRAASGQRPSAVSIREGAT